MERGSSSNDSAWQHAERINDNPSHLRCKFCGHTMWGGITRFKQHLAQLRGDVIACRKCPPEVTLEFKESIINRILDGGERKRQRRDSSENVKNTETHVHRQPPSSDAFDIEDNALIEQAIKESIKTHVLERKKAKIDEDAFEAACHESMRSYQGELQRQREGCSRNNGERCSRNNGGYESTDIDFGSDSDFSL